MTNGLEQDLARAARVNNICRVMALLTVIIAAAGLALIGLWYTP